MIEIVNYKLDEKSALILRNIEVGCIQPETAKGMIIGLWGVKMFVTHSFFGYSSKMVAKKGNQPTGDEIKSGRFIKTLNLQPGKIYALAPYWKRPYIKPYDVKAANRRYRMGLTNKSYKPHNSCFGKIRLVFTLEFFESGIKLNILDFKKVQLKGKKMAAQKIVGDFIEQKKEIENNEVNSTAYVS